MAKFRKGLPTVENYSSRSENEEYFDPPNDEDRRKRKRQIKPPKKFSEYETEGSMRNTEDELCMYSVCIYCFKSVCKSFYFNLLSVAMLLL